MLPENVVKKLELVKRERILTRNPVKRDITGCGSSGCGSNEDNGCGSGTGGTGGSCGSTEYDIILKKVA